jgi:hypothetical protein
MTQLMQHGPLPGENQQKREGKGEANPTHFNGEFQVQSRRRLSQSLNAPDSTGGASIEYRPALPRRSSGAG